MPAGEDNLIRSWYIPEKPSVLVSVFGRFVMSACNVSSVLNPVTTGFDSAATPAAAEALGNTVESDSWSP